MLSKGRLDRIRDIAGAVGIWPEEREALNDLLAELARLRPVVAAAQEWHTTREGVAKLDQMSGSEWFVQRGVAMREHQQAADKLAAVVAAVAGEKGEQVGSREVERVGRVMDAVLAEYSRAVQQYGGFASPHEGLAVIWEEFEELKELVRRRQRDRVTLLAMHKEAVQISAMGLRFAVEMADALAGEGE